MALTQVDIDAMALAVADPSQDDEALYSAVVEGLGGSETFNIIEAYIRLYDKED